ncbi:MAG: hypothetical protein ACTSRI_02570 [Promethearchaeota archaeon]
MIFQGLFNILDLYSNEIELFYHNIDEYFIEKFNSYFKGYKKEEYNLDDFQKKFSLFIKEKSTELGFKSERIGDNHSIIVRKLQNNDFKEITSIKKLYEKIAPIIHEIFLKKIFNYLISPNEAQLILNLKSKGLIPIEFIMELRNLKFLFEKSPERKKNLKKYIQIEEKIIDKLLKNKEKIERIEKLEDYQDKLQLFYMIYKIIAFFNMQKLFDLSDIKEYIKNNCSEWLDSIPLLSLKNPDLYYCGIYLLKHLSIFIEEEELDNIKYFLLNIYDENIDEFESPIIEATYQVSFLLEASSLIELGLSIAQIKELLKGDIDFYNPNYLKNLETSQLVIILKIFTGLGVHQLIESQKIKPILDEIKKRITSEEVKQFRNGVFSAEATYHVVFCNYMRDSLKDLIDVDFIDKIISKIYRNLEMLNFSEETNYDLISEIYYSCETLKLLNGIKTKHALIHLARYLFPQQIVNKILNGKKITASSVKFNHSKISKITGQTIF